MRLSLASTFWLLLSSMLCVSSLSSARAQTPSLPAYAGDFFAAPAASSLPSTPGVLLRYQAHEAGSPGVYKVMYSSTMTRHENGVTTSFIIPATGLVSIPATTPPASGFKTLVFAHGTLGVIPKCGPSRLGAGWKSWMLTPNVKTVAPDYPGLGVDAGLRSSDAAHRSAHPWYVGLVYQYPFDETTHPYMSLQGEARTSIDLVRAARTLEAVLAGLTAPSGNIGTNTDFAIIGASQGGMRRSGPAS